jgi:hypothetical protein
VNRQEPLEEERVVAAPGMDGQDETTPGGVVVATFFVVAVLTVIGVILGFFAAFLVVKIGLPMPKLTVGLPLVAVGGLAWGLSASDKTRDSLLAAVTAGGIFVAVMIFADPPHPSSLFYRDSKLVDVDVDVGKDTADLTFETTTKLTEIPAFTTFLLLALVLAALSYGLCSLARPLHNRHQARKALGF